MRIPAESAYRKIATAFEDCANVFGYSITEALGGHVGQAYAEPQGRIICKF